jgi:hypothetical protein
MVNLLFMGQLAFILVKEERANIDGTVGWLGLQSQDTAYHPVYMQPSMMKCHQASVHCVDEAEYRYH